MTVAISPVVQPSQRLMATKAVESPHGRSLAAMKAASPSMCTSAVAFDKYSDCSCSGAETADASTSASTAKRAKAQRGAPSSASTASRFSNDGCSTSSGDEMTAWSMRQSADESTNSCFSDSEVDADAIASVMYPIALLLQLRAVVCNQAARARSRGAALEPPIVYSARRIDDLGVRPVAEVQKPLKAAERSPDTSSKKKNKKKRANAALPETSSSSWAAHQQKADGSDDERVARAARSILNKLTIEKFDSLYEQLVLCGFSTPEHIAILMREVFEKATMQHHFIAMYADLCVRLEKDPRLASAMGIEGEPTSFKRLLLTQCQAAFEKLLEPPSAVPVSMDDIQTDEEQEGARKRRALGNVKFVGELLNRGMLSSRLLVACAESLLQCQDACPEALESLSALLTVAGKQFDGRPEWQYTKRFDAIFILIQELTKNKKVPARVRFLLRDLLELREAGWPQQGRPAIAQEGPMRLDEVKERAMTEVFECQKASNTGGPNRQARGFKNKDVSARTGAPRNGTAATPWQSNVKKATWDDWPNREWKGERTSKATPKVDAKSAIIKGAVEVAKQADDPQPAVATVALAPFNPRLFHREMSLTLRDLSADGNVGAAVRRIRAQNVPLVHHAKEFADLLTRAAEETRGPARRSAFAFAAGLAAAEPSAFDRTECIAGTKIFFAEVYEDLCDEVPRLQAIAISEMVPTLQSVFPVAVLKELLPEDMRAEA